MKKCADGVVYAAHAPGINTNVNGQGRCDDLPMGGRVMVIHCLVAAMRPAGGAARPGSISLPPVANTVRVGTSAAHLVKLNSMHDVLAPLMLIPSTLCN